MTFIINSVPITGYTHLTGPELLKQSKKILDSVETSWTKHKAQTVTVENYHQNIDIQTYSNHDLNHEYWCARSTNFTEFDEKSKFEIYKKLDKYAIGSIDDIDAVHTVFEKQYVPTVNDYELIQINDFPGSNHQSIAYFAKMYYKFGFPVKNRLFYQFTYVFKDETSGYVIQLPIDPNLFHGDSAFNKDYVIGKYVSMERITYDKITGNVNWLMATIPAPGGMIPDFIVKMTTRGEICKDVPHFFNYVNKLEPDNNPDETENQESKSSI